ncbi:MAG: hypothetical protein KDE51_06695 [Anaerolineales bacterium]|nr:hypothetical protein [Anaerolineales bacterium]
MLSGAICLAALLFLEPWAFLLLFTIAAVAFGILVYFHRKVRRSSAQTTIWLSWAKTQLARSTLDWTHIPAKAAENPTPLETDFDLVGRQSVHQLLDTAVSKGGSGRLREWLANDLPELTEIQRRQALVRELVADKMLRGRLNLRARLAADQAQESQWSTAELLEWLNKNQTSSNLRWLVMVLGLLAVVNLILMALNLMGVMGSWWQLSLGLYVLLSVSQASKIGDTFQQAATLRDMIERLTGVFQLLETHAYRKQPRLKELCQPFLEQTTKPSHFLRRVGRVVNATSLRGNPPLWLALNFIGPWDYYFSYRLEQYKREIVHRLPVWLEVWFEVEALSSLANFAYLHPQYTFPELAESAETPYLAAVQLGHPLIPEAAKVCNDLEIDQLPFLGIITGSNMAGKSSFLRTVGINLLLAYAGGVVNAQTLTARPLRLFSCIRVADSVIDGISYFYAEVKRLKTLLEELEKDDPRPLFFFIDEIFRGTNNRERLQGRRAYLRAVAQKSGIGLISTHDLELVTLADEISQAVNYHFREEVQDGRMVFDYTLRSGPCPTTNALRIMALEGLPVADGKLENETV